MIGILETVCDVLQRPREYRTFTEAFAAARADNLEIFAIIDGSIWQIGPDGSAIFQGKA